MSTLRERLVEAIDDPEILLADGFDDAFIGVGMRCGQPAVTVYDIEKCVKVLMSRGMTEDEAVEFFDFNVVGAWVGPRTPLFLAQLDDA